jgi:hypothetical protein
MLVARNVCGELGKKGAIWDRESNDSMASLKTFQRRRQKIMMCVSQML